ncbi:MAG TPA: PKD domain-containing protein [Solirubrobacterales bacterium]|nr:PKD domain-containing protein [Solirubrobacterales bacterium]
MKRPNNSLYPVALALILALLAVLPASAGAVVRSTPTGPASFLPLEGAGIAKGAGPLGASVPTGSPPLLWHGGPVMPSHEAFAIFWAPSGFSFPSGYKTAITEYLENVGADSGLSTNVYSVSAQYTGSNGRANYSDSFGGSVDDTDAYPTSGTCPAYEGFHGVEYTACISDAKMKAEVTSVVAAQEWPTGLGAEYYVVLPPQAGSCFGTTSTSGCFDKEFCAYHSFVSSPKLVYANISYSPGDVSGCGVGEYPNGHANGNVDDTLSSLSHEANESITDPELNAWFDGKGFENGDECRNTPFGEDYGSPLGGSAGSLFNESIGGGHYYLQQEWSNDVEDCAQRVGPATPVIANPGSIEPGQVVHFNGAGSVPGDEGITAFEWDFGDGGTGSGPNPTHSYGAVGNYTVTLTLTDESGFTYSASRQVSVSIPEPPAPGGQPGGNNNPSPPPPPAAGTAVAAGKAKVKNGVALVKLTCQGAGACSGVVKLLDHGSIGHAAFSIAAGKTVVLHVKLTHAGIVLLANKSGSLKVKLTGTGVKSRSVSLVPNH